METMWNTYAEEQQKIGEVKGSDRTFQAFEMLADGKTVQEIANALDIPLDKVEEYAKIAQKFRES